MNSLLVSFLLFGTPPQPPMDTEARRLFEEGRAAFKAGNTDQACATFQKSYSLVPTIGTLLNLAACLEKQGHVAAAWLHYNEAVSWAKRTHEADREAFARQQAQTLKAKVSWVALVADEPVDVTVDGETVHVAQVATAVPVDAGVHEVALVKPGAAAWKASVTVATGATVQQRIPTAKVDAPVASAPAPQVTPVTPATAAPLWVATPTVVQVSQPQPTSAPAVTLVVSGSVVALAGGASLAWSLSTYDQLQKQRVGRASLADVSQWKTVDDVERLRWLYPTSWAAAGVGVAAIGVGTVLLFTTNRAGVTVAPSIHPGGGAVSVAGKF